MIIRDLTKAGAKAACISLLLAGFGLAAITPAEAAGSGAVRVKEASAAKTTAKDPETTGSVATPEKVSAEPGPNCAQSRKRLWVEGEGWIVRRVTTCF